MTEQLFKEPTPELAKDLIRYLPTRPDYQTWLYTISAIGNTFSENVAIDILLSHFQDEKTNETIYKVNKRLNGVTFGTFVYLAKQYGYKLKKTYTNRLYGDFLKQGISKHVPKITFNDETEMTYRFFDYGLEERAGIYEFESNITRVQAEMKIINQFPYAERERTYRIAINDKVLNKNLNPKTQQSHQNYTALTNEYKNFNFSLNEIVYSIGKGYAVCCCHLKEDKNGNTIRKSENWICSDLFAIDIDEGKTIDEVLKMNETRKALLLYTSPSHTAQKNRFRILFPLPRIITNKEHFEKIVSHYINYYSADKQCKEPVRAFYGNNNADIYNIQTGEIIEFRNGVML